VSAIAAATSRISPVNERLYHQSNLLGDWKGSFTKTHQAVEFKVVSITGNTAQVEYTHNGHTERGTATVDQNTITFGNVTIGTRDGQKAAIEFSFTPQGSIASSGAQSGILSKVAGSASDQNPLIGSWTGATADSSVSFTVTSINGRDAQVKYAIDGNSGQGVGDVLKNAVLLGPIQFTNIDGTNGKVTFQINHKTISLAVKRFTPKTA